VRHQPVEGRVGAALQLRHQLGLVLCPGENARQVRHARRLSYPTPGDFSLLDCPVAWGAAPAGPSKLRGAGRHKPHLVRHQPGRICFPAWLRIVTPPTGPWQWYGGPGGTVRQLVASGTGKTLKWWSRWDSNPRPPCHHRPGQRRRRAEPSKPRFSRRYLAITSVPER